ncbi:hypothetical protein N7468_001357 [Penicillium chermesinum]|uniref:S-adenosyl-L-methionine-dependent methyltransferase n=1 Tax=Penicillium chermesinum TaxID=63820 RepID=A0A9W9PGN1_9EURO|nr:uncharacterized protein N7468_001357 [Penicillium chermesinum]KAJ5246374.1 hypothetical protein N7468_001357 [Penicillium chermesinum]
MTQPNALEHIQIDTSDEESLFATQSILDSNFSFASSVRDYCYENGRRYHAYRHGQYPFPNDEEEQDRLAVMHHLFKLVLGGDLYRAPFARDRPPTRILDIGTGTGEWAIEISENFPGAEIIGTDLSPIQPGWVPSNCRFFIDDVESDWAFTPGEAFDFIHARTMGWFEVQEFAMELSSDDGSHHMAPTVMEWLNRVNDASKQFGKDLNIAKDVAGWMRKEGYVNVHDDIYKAPVGGWAKNPRMKEIGRMTRITVNDIIEPYSLALMTRVIGLSYQEVQEYMERVRAEFLNPKVHFHFYFHFVYGQRPLDDTEAQT